MWTLEQLREEDPVQTCIDDKWVPARPENYKKKTMSFWQRIKHGYAVFSGKAEAFTWPLGQ